MGWDAWHSQHYNPMKDVFIEHFFGDGSGI